jgi:hypothetical protein
VKSGQNGKDWKGDVNQSGTYSMPGEWDGTNGDHGSTITSSLMVAGDAIQPCTDLNGANGCILVVPLCYADPSNSSGYEFPLYCVAYGLFDVYSGPGQSRDVGMLVNESAPLLLTGGSGTASLPTSGGVAVINLAQ